MNHKFCSTCKCNLCIKSCKCGICYDSQDSKQRIACDMFEAKNGVNRNKIELSEYGIKVVSEMDIRNIDIYYREHKTGIIVKDGKPAYRVIDITSLQA